MAHVAFCRSVGATFSDRLDAIDGITVTCSDNPPRISSHYCVAVPMDKAAELEFTRSDKSVWVRIATISSRS